MKIPTEFTKESNYEGTRLIEIKDENIIALKKELDVLQGEANPILIKMEGITPELDVYFEKVGKLRGEIDVLNQEVQPNKDKYQELQGELDVIEQKAILVKNKIQPMVNALVAPELGEFEKAMQLREVDGTILVEVQDEVEEKIKAIREAKYAKVI